MGSLPRRPPLDLSLLRLSFPPLYSPFGAGGGIGRRRTPRRQSASVAGSGTWVMTSVILVDVNGVAAARMRVIGAPVDCQPANLKSPPGVQWDRHSA